MILEPQTAAPSMSAIGIDMKRGRNIVFVQLHIIIHAIRWLDHGVVIAQGYPCPRRVAVHLLVAAVVLLLALVVALAKKIVV